MKVIRSKIPIGIVVRGGGGFDPLCRRAGDKIPIGIYWSEGVAGLIPHAGELKVEGTFPRDIVVREGGGLVDP